ncbi:MAG: DUF1499 domain-containing protein [Rhizobiaceae bacterium]|nr:DUF1499 domain-containing protein [Rhizobiaceae bacterium]
MAVLLERRVSTVAKWSRRTALFSATLLASTVLGHRSGLIDTISLFWLLGLIVAMALLAILLAVLGYVQLWEFGDRGGRNSTKGLILALIVLMPFCLATYRLLTLPALVDVSSDLSDPPTFHHAIGRRDSSMNTLAYFDRSNAAVQAEAYPEVSGRRFALGLDVALDIVAATTEELGWSTYERARLGGFGGIVTLEVVAPSPWLGLISDVAIRLRDEGDAIYIDLRSASRYGVHDLGGNAAAITRFYAAMETEIADRNALFQAPAE